MKLPDKAFISVQDDPICGSGGCGYIHMSASPDPANDGYDEQTKVIKHPMNYGVTDHGPDDDIAGTQANAKAAEAEAGHEWVVPEKWADLPSEDAEFKLVSIGEKIRMMNDPPFNSHSGYKTWHFKDEGEFNTDGVPHVDYDYDAPLDEDIKWTLGNAFPNSSFE
jgi:hypothetical protein